MTSNLTLKIVTWNVSGLAPPQNVNLEALFVDGGESLTDADVLAVGLQEVSYRLNNYLYDVVVRNEPWSEAIKQFLVQHNYIQLSCGWTSKPRLMGLILLIFVKRTSALSIVQIETKYAKTGFSGYSSHKGAVCTRLTFRDGTHVTLVNSHLSHGPAALPYRIKEYFMILDGLKFDSSTVISNDYVFWFGDLNFRVENLTFAEIMRLIETGYVDKVLEFDQLHRCIASERAFNQFQEAPITFKPTYKFLEGTSSYNPKILYRTEEAHSDSERKLLCQVVNYQCITSYCNSDHKPVSANFVLNMYEYAFDYFVRFDLNVSWRIGQNNLCKFKVSNLYSMSMFDWIGIFRPGFHSDTDSVTWLYMASAWEDNEPNETAYQTQNVSFKQSYIPPPGTYLFGYYSRERNCLISLSESFQVYDENTI